ncbi:CBS domain-containing protein [Candidatus Bathyarchaeota archaeon]|nr:CBS domain-containing protein [Candidatus Bathyarchaeota archaeon]
MESIKQLAVSNLISAPLVISEATPVSKVVGVLKNEDAYEVFTQDRGRVGMVMIRDILKAWNVATEKVESLVSPAPRLSPGASLSEAARLMMQDRVRALPIVEGDKLTGSILATSIIQAIPSSIVDKYCAQDIMTPNPAGLDVDDEVSKARALMLRRRIDHLPIVRNRKLAGLLTSSKIVFDVYQRIEGIEGYKAMVDNTQRRLAIPVKDLMDLNPLTSEPSDKISNVLKRMLDMKATYCLITQFDEIQGIITYRDFMKLIAEEIVKSDIPVYIVGLPDDPFESEQTRTKFMRSIETLRKTMPKIQEARAVIQTREGPERERRRYEVSVTLVTPRKNYSYSSTGFELANMFDDVQSHFKTMTAERPKRVRRSRRYDESGT